MNTITKRIVLAVALVSALIGVRVFLAIANAPNDQVLIEKALDESIEASREGRPGGVLDKLSDKFTLNSEQPSFRQIAQFVKESKPEVTVTNRKAVVTGDEARISTPVQLKLNLLGQEMNQQLDDVTIVFRREDAREWLIIPVKQWKLAEVRVEGFTDPTGMTP